MLLTKKRRTVLAQSARVVEAQHEQDSSRTVSEPRATSQVEEKPASPCAAALVHWLDTEARSHVRPGARVAVVGADAVRHARELVHRGYDATLVARSGDEAASLQAQAPELPTCVLKADARVQPLSGRFDLVVGVAAGRADSDTSIVRAADLARRHGSVLVMDEDAPGATQDSLAAKGFSHVEGMFEGQSPLASLRCLRRDA